MQYFKELFQKVDNGSVNLETVEQLLSDFNLDVAMFDEYKNETDEYLRIPIYEGNYSVYVMKWPMNGKSTIHEHRNISGVIKVLRGKIQENSFLYDGVLNKLVLKEKLNYSTGSIIIEEVNAIHQVINVSEHEDALTLHVYFPSARNLEGSRLFNVQDKKIGVLNEKASSFNWSQPAFGFSEIIIKSFDYVEEC
ncbi:MAG: cysteine dioxygenase family protein [Flavobacteriales bacterium]|nr:cysteine dioxygenase family protein [Flavobacteriales bacterium]MCL4857159.1 cysteine dioxygenase family protein [Flavobacteriales bacterium]